MLEKEQGETFAQYIIRLRKSKGYSQRKLAQVTGISNTTISRIEKGETLSPDIDTVKLLATHLKIDEIYMMKAAGYLNEDKDLETSSSKNLKDEFIKTLIELGKIKNEDELTPLLAMKFLQEMFEDKKEDTV